MEVLETYRIVQGDTIHGISQKMYGDISQAMEIIIANSLVYPYVVGSFEEEVGEGVKTPGDVLIIPKKVSDRPPILDSEVSENALGSDILLNHGESLLLNSYFNGDIETNFYSDIETIEGVGTLKQDLIHKLVTRPGSLVCHPHWGSGFIEIIGNKDVYGWREKASVEMERCFRSDDRVEDVKNIKIESIHTGVIIRCDVITIQGVMTLEERLEL